MSGDVIDEIFAFVVLDAGDGNEGVIGFRTADGTWMPMLGADMKRIDSLRPLAQSIADRSGVTVSLRRFSARTDLETLTPREEPQ
jgi:hypothetical protein